MAEFCDPPPHKNPWSGSFDFFSNFYVRGNRYSYVCVWRCRHELPFPHHLWILPNVLIPNIVYCALGHLEINANYPHCSTTCSLLMISERCECILCFATGDASPLKTSISFRTLCTKDLATSKKHVQSQHRSALLVSQQFQNVVSSQPLAERTPLILWKVKNHINYHITTSAQSTYA